MFVVVWLLFCTEGLNLHEMQFYFKFDDNRKTFHNFTFHYIVRNPPSRNDRIFIGII